MQVHSFVLKKKKKLPCDKNKLYLPSGGRLWFQTENRKFTHPTDKAEAESKEKHGVWEPMPELTTAFSYYHFRVDSNTFTVGNPMPESTLTLCQSRLYPPVRDLGFGLCSHGPRALYTEKQTFKFRVILNQ
jgi:hypothetical protein